MNTPPKQAESVREFIVVEKPASTQVSAEMNTEIEKLKDMVHGITSAVQVPKTPTVIQESEEKNTGRVKLHNTVRAITSAVQQIVGTAVGSVVGGTAGVMAMTIPTAVVGSTVVLSGGIPPLGALLGAVAGWRYALKSKLPKQMAQWIAPVRKFWKTKYSTKQQGLNPQD